ncbi:hypothetical protein IKQ26_01125 [bacterium]|nr:hypothetical protein [bacterium]
MKHLFKLFLLVVVSLSFTAFSEEQENNIPPENKETVVDFTTQTEESTTEPKDEDEEMEEAFQKAIEQVKQNDELKQPWEMKKEKKPKDPRTLNEKVRRKLHLPKTRKIYYHNLDLSRQPMTNIDYKLMAADVKRENFKIPEPVYQKKPKFVIPDPHYRVVFYNTPPGARRFELNGLYKYRKLDSQSILSPDKQRIVYTSVYYYPKLVQTGYDAHYIKVKEGVSIPDALKKTYITQQEMKPIVSSVNDKLDEYRLATLFPLDWSKDGSKIAFKEQIGSTVDGVWETNVIVYDFNTEQTYRLDTLREAVEYYWRVNFGIDITKYMWDLYPVGWSAEDENRIVFYAYAFSKTKPYFLGTWSIDFEETSSRLISIDETFVPISVNGYGLRLIELAY